MRVLRMIGWWIMYILCLPFMALMFFLGALANRKR